MKKQIFRETDGIRGKVGEEPLTKESMHRLGRAIGQYFRGGKVLIGRDTRESGVWISQEISAGMRETGCEVWDVGEVTTPCVGVLTGVENVKGGVMVTASHNPASENGVKVFDGRGDKLTDYEELEVEKLFFADTGEKSPQVGEEIDKTTLIDGYIEKAMTGVDLDGWKICTDSAAGGAWQIAQKAFAGAGATVVEIGVKPDGKNINEGSGALYPEKLAEVVLREGADMGVAFDGDADRLILVDDEGEIWDGDRIVAVMALWLKEKGKLANDAVVMTEYSNLSAVLFLGENGVRVEKVLNGDRAVAQKCQEIGAVLGGEVAGHIIYPEWLSASDGLFASALIAEIAHEKGVKLSVLRPKYKNFPSKLWNLPVTERKPLEEIEGWQEGLEKEQKFLGVEGRTFARYSGTEDLLRILVEAKDAKKMEEVGERLSEIIKKEIGK